jgi:hypothetical protein
MWASDCFQFNYVFKIKDKKGKFVDQDALFLVPKNLDVLGL